MSNCQQSWQLDIFLAVRSFWRLEVFGVHKKYSWRAERANEIFDERCMSIRIATEPEATNEQPANGAPG